MSTDNKVKLRSSDSEIFYVREQVANQWEMVRSLIEDVGTDNVIPIPNIESKILAKVIRYSEYHVESKVSSNDKPPIPVDEVKQWDAEFIMVEDYTLFSLILAANYLNIPNLITLASQAVADFVYRNDCEETRKKFGIVNDLTPEEEAEVRQENSHMP